MIAYDSSSYIGTVSVEAWKRPSASLDEEETVPQVYADVLLSRIFR